MTAVSKGGKKHNTEWCSWKQLKEDANKINAYYLYDVDNAAGAFFTKTRDNQWVTIY